MVEVESVAQACQRLGCKERQLFYMLERGILQRANRCGREIRILSSSVDEFLLYGESKRRGSKRQRSPYVPEVIDPAAVSI